MKQFLSFAFCLFTSLSFSQSNLTVLGRFQYNTTTSNLTGYVDSLGREYALVGTAGGLSIVAIDTPTNPRQLFSVPGALGQGGFWREVREYKGYAYVTTEQASGLVIVNLKYLPDSIQYHTINPGGMTTSHTIFIDSNGIAYVNGTDEDLLFLDLNANPYNPPVIGKFSNNYVHDCFVRNDTMWAACINDGILKVVDVRNKTTTNAPVNNITSWATPLNFSHNCWLSDDSKYLFTTDEKPNSTLTCYDVSDLNNITETDRTQVDPGSNTIIHNTYFLNNYCISSYYTYGITIHDVSRKNNLVEVGSYDSSPTYSGDGFHGAWGVWPYLPSGNIIVSDIETGLWILKPTYKRACYLEGVVKDTICNTFLNDVKIEIVGDSVSDFTNFLGKYSTGTPDSGTYTIRFSKNGYQTQDFSNVNLQNGVLTTINVNLLPVSTTRLVIKTVDASTGNALPFIRVLITDTSDTAYQEITTDAAGEYKFCDFVQGECNFYGGIWGRITAKVSKSVSVVADTVIIAIGNGYYDDFIMDYGWTVSTTASSGDWQRGEPIGTETNQGVEVNPEDDIAGDFGTDCYVTGNNGGDPSDDDVDNGSTILRSPVFDLSTYVDPYLSYYRWFYNGGGNGSAPNDSLTITVTNGADTVLLDWASADTLMSQWRYKNFRLNDFIAPSSNMRIAFKAQDTNPGHYVEAGLDIFQIVDSGATDIQSVTQGIFFNIYPNPVSNKFIVERNSSSAASLFLYDVTGRILKEQILIGNKSSVSVAELSKGVYVAKLFEGRRMMGEKKLVKVE